MNFAHAILPNFIRGNWQRTLECLQNKTLS